MSNDALQDQVLGQPTTCLGAEAHVQGAEVLGLLAARAGHGHVQPPGFASEVAGGQEIVNNWVLSMDLTPVQFMLLAQFIIFILGWPLEWTEIIVIFMPIFIPLLDNFGVDPLFFGLLVALNLQTAFLSPPVAMSAPQPPYTLSDPWPPCTRSLP